ncbi:MAG: efflux RND transporter permease subunit [Bacteroidales bacterium]|jgi:HAE1 family hydrophobic/amphiphilic exporter-1|nr:efflux RND transporter permease subunit [Bacteroidales bacterium]
MSIYKSAVKNPISTLMIFVAIIAFGLYSLTRLPVDLYPEMELPAMSVMTIYTGANSSEIETNVTKIIENTLNSVDKLKEITSKSIDNMSVVTLEFEWGSDLDQAANDVRNALELVKRNMPDGAESPIIFKFNSSMMPIMFYSITSNESYYGIEKIINDKVVNYLNRIDGIGSVGLSGLPTRKIYVEVDPVKIEAMHLTLEQLGSLIAAENINVPAGNIKTGLIDYQLKIEGEFKESTQIKNLILGNFNGQEIKLADVAEIRDTIKDMTIDNYVFGEKSVSLVIQKQSGANTVAVAKNVTAEIERIQKTLPPDVKFHQIYDSSEFINNSINNLTETLFYALIFVVLVVLLFLGRWRATIIIVITIPISLLTAFIFLGLTGGSINIISLTSLSIAIGMVVDDAIVVLENITHHIERGSSPREAAIYATNEVWLAVLVTTLVIVAVFLPLTMVSGMTGVLFFQLGWIVTITIVTSTVAAISLTPMLSSKLLRLKPLSKKRFSYDRTIRVVLDKLDQGYEKLIRFVLRHKVSALIVSVLIFASTLFFLPGIGTEMMPQADQARVSATIKLQPGVRHEEATRIAKQIQDIAVEKYPEIKTVQFSSGVDDEAGIASLFGTSGTNIISFTMRLSKKHERERTVWEIQDDFRKQLALIPEIDEFTVSDGQGGGGMMGGNSVDVEIFGYDFDKTNNLAQEISNKIKTIDGARDIQISREKEKPEFEFVLDKDKMATYGLNTATVAIALRNRVTGLTASIFREDGDEYDIVVRLPEHNRKSIQDIENIVVANSKGIQIRLSDVGKVEETFMPPNIDHKRRERIVKVSVTPYEISLGQLATKIEEKLNDIDIPNDILVDVGGAYEDQQESFSDLGLLMMLALLLVYIVMAAQFESFKMPLIIMISIPFSFAGVILALWLTGTNLSIVAALGAVLLIGIVVKNGIVLVDYINLMRDREYSLYEAIALSGKSRLRPVLMTALTTGLGMLPLALSNGEGSEIWKPMGIVVIGGLLFSTVLTMIVIPVMYAVLDRPGSRKRKQKVHQKDYAFMNDVVRQEIK